MAEATRTISWTEFSEDENMVQNFLNLLNEVAVELKGEGFLPDELNDCDLEITLREQEA